MGCIYLVRHAQASFGSGVYDRLSAFGREQATLAGAYLARAPGGISNVVCGSLERQQDTAAEIASRVHTVSGKRLEVRLDARFNEIDLDQQFGRIFPMLVDHDGQLKSLLPVSNSSSRAYQKIFKAIFLCWQNLADQLPDCESWSEFSTRTIAAIREAVRTAEPGANSVIVTSAGVIAAITQQILGLPNGSVYPLIEAMLNCSVTRLVHDRQRISLASFNDCSYLTALKHMHEGRSILTYR
jgi:broad specificity phosphatase PhoE